MTTGQPTSIPPTHPVVTGVANVKGSDGTIFTVNFDTGVCNCDHGQPYRYDRKGDHWYEAHYCNHKLKAVASLVSRTPEDKSLYDFYEFKLGKRYNIWESVSAFHKELRKGDKKRSIFWANAMVPHRGWSGLVNYCRNILFEETRDLQLGHMILDLSQKGKTVKPAEVQALIRRFCESPKKWELPWRYEIFMDEMRAYRKLAEKYRYDVAKGKDIIPADQIPSLCKELLAGFKEGDRVRAQYGLKGWFKSHSPHKSKANGHDLMKLDIFNTLTDVLNHDFPNKFDIDEDYAHAVHEFVMRRIKAHGAPGYHELNALADALTGERGGAASTVTPLRHRILTAPIRRQRMPLGTFYALPLYSKDNHTWAGKALMRTWGDKELQPGVEQEHLDFRMCGAYLGVAWRTLAYKQHGTVDCKWSEVSWKSPNWLWGHIKQMFY